MKQLVMVRLNGPYTERPLPEGYHYAAFHESENDPAEWLRIIFDGTSLPEDGGAEYYSQTIKKYPDVTPDKDVFFIVDSAGKKVATTTVVKHADHSGYVHMVQTIPGFRGKGLGHCLIEHAVRLLDERDVTYMLLTTDDFRLAAIKTYLDAGFCPVLVEDPKSSMSDRWDTILKQLQYGKVRFLTETDYASIRH